MQNGMWKFIAVVVLALLVLGANAQTPNESLTVFDIKPMYNLTAPGMPMLITGMNFGVMESINPFDPPTVVQGWTVSVDDTLSRITGIGSDHLQFIVPVDLRFVARKTHDRFVKVSRFGVVLVTWPLKVEAEAMYLELGSEKVNAPAGFYIQGSKIFSLADGRIQISTGVKTYLAMYTRGWGYNLVGLRVAREKARLEVSGEEVQLTVVEDSLYVGGTYGGEIVVFEWPVTVGGTYTVKLWKGLVGGTVRQVEVIK